MTLDGAGEAGFRQSLKCTYHESLPLMSAPFPPPSPLSPSVFLCSGIAFSSSGEEEDCDSPFDGLHTQHALKISHSDGYEDDPEGVEPQGPAHHTSPTALSNRAAAYVSGSLGADSTTHQDLSSAGLERDGERERLSGRRVRGGGWGGWSGVGWDAKLPAMIK